MIDNQPTDQAPTPAAPGELPRPEPDELARKWGNRVRDARKHWEKLHKRIAHNRKLVAGFNWGRDPATKEFIDPRANLIFSTVQATLPNIYARNPDVSVTGTWRNGNVRLFCETMETVLSKQMKGAKLKKRMKMAVLGAMTEYFGILKLTYQRDIQQDPLIMDRMNDAQDNIVRLEGLIQRAERPEDQQQHELDMQELQETLKGLEAESEIVAAEGMVIDRVLPENLLIAPSVVEFDDYEDSPWIAQLVPMPRRDAEARYKVDLRGATVYRPEAMGKKGAAASEGGGTPIDGKDPAADEDQICVIEIWDKTSGLVYTMADGCNFWLRESYSVEKVGQRWYPFFILPYASLPGQFVAPCLVDLTEKLQDEHNETRDKFAAHRELNKPGWYGDAEALTGKTIKRHTDAVLGEVTLVDAQGKPLNQVIAPKVGIPINPLDYDTAPIRYDWEQVTGLQDAARSTMVQPKTATEASIMQQSLSGRTAEFRDKIEDTLQEMDEYTAQILLQELTPAQVERYTGPHDTAMVPDPMSGQLVEQVIEPAYDWPQLRREQIFDMVEVGIVAGTTGAPDKAQAQEMWIQLMPAIMPLIQQIMQLAAQGVDYSPLKALLTETLHRFDDRLDVDSFLPQNIPAPAPAMPGMAPGAAPLPPGAGQPPANDPMAAVQQGGPIPGAPGQAPAIPAVIQ